MLAPDRREPRGYRLAVNLLLQKIQQVRFREFLLRSVGQRFQSPRTFGNFIIAEDEGIARAELVGALERFAEFQFGGRQFDSQAGHAESPGRDRKSTRLNSSHRTEPRT